MPDFLLNFRVGSVKTGTRNPDPAALAARAVEMLRAQGEKKGVEQLLEIIVSNQEQIRSDISADAARFGAAVARLFTKVKSPKSGTATISMDELNLKGNKTTQVGGSAVIEWLALTQRTVENKRRRMRSSRGSYRSAGEPSTFFVETGELRKVLINNLGPAFGMLVDPKIVVRRGPRRVSAILSIMATASGREKAGVTGANFPGVTGSGSIAREESLFVRYLKKAGAPDRDPRHPLAYKLQNPRGAHRPFLQNSLIFWISHRLPLVLSKSLRASLAKRTKRG